VNETIARNVGPARIEVAYERIGDPAAPPMLLIQGIGAHLVGWHEGFCAGLVDHGLQVIRYDNRDVGRSTHFHDAPEPDLPAVLAGDLSSASYRLSDLAADAVGLLDVLGIDTAHVVGASMGGFIAQTVAIEHPGRVRSLTTMMSTTGDMLVGQATPETLRALFAGPRAVTRQEVMDQAVRSVAIVGSPGYPSDPAEVAERAGLAYDRGYDPVGIARQAVACVASGDRTELLRHLDVPTLVLQGSDDVMCDPSGSRAIAAAVPGAELVMIDGMGHNLPRGLWPELTARIARHAQRADRTRTAV
jgi:pimeloyl-ACP methyl ester carboxylesterase